MMRISGCLPGVDVRLADPRKPGGYPFRRCLRPAGIAISITGIVMTGTGWQKPCIMTADGLVLLEKQKSRLKQEQIICKDGFLYNFATS